MDGMNRFLVSVGPLGLLFAPLFANAQGVQEFMINLTIVLDDIVIPFLIGIAFLIFVFNGVRFFVIGGSNEQGRENAKALAIYGVTAFVVMIVFWGIINLLATSIGLEGETNQCPDYQKMRGDC